ncbi:MAG: hypothetical protein AB7O56_04090 [Bauldia sp.]
MRILSRLALLATLPLLVGCFDFTQGVAIAPDGTATVTMVSVMKPQMLAMDPELPGDDFCGPPDAADVPADFTAVAEQTTGDDGSAICTVTMTGPMESLAELLANQALAPDGAEDQDIQVTLTDEGNGEYTYAVVFEIAANDEPAATPEAQLQQQQMETMMLQMMEGGVLTWTLTAPRIISSDGVVDGNTVTYTVPLTAMITDQGTTKGFTVRFALR